MRTPIYLIVLSLWVLPVLAQQDDSNLTEEEMIERLAAPGSVDDLVLQPCTRGFGVVPAAGLSFQAINFEFDSATLTAAAIRLLETVAAAMQSERLTGLRFRVVGHTDAVGSDEYNLRLSSARAAAVREQLTALGLDSKRIDIVGEGERQLADPQAPASARNRRVEIVRAE